MDATDAFAEGGRQSYETQWAIRYVTSVSKKNPRCFFHKKLSDKKRWQKIRHPAAHLKGVPSTKARSFLFLSLR